MVVCMCVLGVCVMCIPYIGGVSVVGTMQECERAIVLNGSYAPKRERESELRQTEPNGEQH